LTVTSHYQLHAHPTALGFSGSISVFKRFSEGEENTVKISDSEHDALGEKKKNCLSLDWASHSRRSAERKDLTRFPFVVEEDIGEAPSLTSAQQVQSLPQFFLDRIH